MTQGGSRGAARARSSSGPCGATQGEERRNKIVAALEGASAPLSGSALAEACGVSRQVVVQDVALLRSRGMGIVSTNRGYVLDREPSRPTRLLKCRHTIDETQDELTCIVDLGARVEDVVVNHRVYGWIASGLDIASRRDVARFMDDIRSGKSAPLMQVTSGYHFHHVSADTEEVLDEVRSALAERGYLAALTDYEAGQLEASAR